MDDERIARLKRRLTSLIESTFIDRVMLDKAEAADLLALLGENEKLVKAWADRQTDLRIALDSIPGEDILVAAKRVSQERYAHKAALAEARPLLEVVEKAPIRANMLDDRIKWIDPNYLNGPLEQAALAYRQKKEGWCGH